MADRQHTSFNYGEQTAKIIRRRVVPKSDEFDSVKNFHEQAIETHAPEIQKLASGGEVCRQLTTLLDEVRDMQVEQPTAHEEMKIFDENLSDESPTVELTPRTLDLLKRSEYEMGVSRSEVIRRCILYSLYKTSKRTDLISGWREDKIVSTWEEICDGMQRPKTKFYEILSRRFLDERMTTVKKIRDDKKGFEYFAEEYTREFHGTHCYDQLRNLRDERTLSTVENIIEEHSKYTIPRESETKGFLEDYLEEE